MCRLDNLLNSVNWAEKWGRCFNLSNYKALHIGKNNPNRIYEMTKTKWHKVYRANCIEEKDLRVEIDQNLNFDNHIQKQINKANIILGIIRRTFDYINKAIFLYL